MVIQRRHLHYTGSVATTLWASQFLPVLCPSPILGTSFRVEIDHKPLVPLLSSKALDEVPI